MLRLEVDDAMSSDASVFEFERIGLDTNPSGQIRGVSKRSLGIKERVPTSIGTKSLSK
jgi:hypothetical protein